MKRLILTAGAALVGLAFSAAQAVDFDASAIAGTIQAPDKAQAGVYIISLVDQPAVGYEGGHGRLKATKPAKGQKINPNSASVKKYADYLRNQHSDVLQSVGGGAIIYDYVYAINGFAAVLTADQVTALRAHTDVQNVWKDEIRQPETNSTPDYLGLRGADEVWDTYGKGEDVIIGIIDSGVWPEHPSFSDQKDLSSATGSSGKRNLAYGPAPAGWSGTCQVGERWSQENCNNKLIGARYYADGFTAHGNSGLLPAEYRSPRDFDGHGSHTASTAGGNEGVANTFGSVSSGVAPRARIAAYKVCWEPRVGDGGCASSDSAAAIDQAVADGVDVINFSIGGASTVFAGPEEIAFLFAAASGVHVATSNGNSGPDPETTGTPAGVPWITSVGAAQDDEVVGANLLVMGPTSVAGTYIGAEGGGDVAFTASDMGTLEVASDLEACGPLSNSFAGNWALISRGTCAFTDKYNNAAAAGASAIVVYNNAGDTPIVMSAPGTSIPGMMIGQSDGETLAAVVEEVLARVEFVSGDNRIAGFSSRGANAGARDVIKPDLAAPGVNIIAAGSGGGDIKISGTSMSSPHVAGAMALLKEAHSEWSPSMIKSALMTSGRQNLKKSLGDDAADPFDIGAGHIVPGAAFNPGLVYDAGFFEYLAFTCGNNVQLVSNDGCSYFTSLGIPTDGSDFNQGSIGVAELVGTQDVTRTVTSTSPDETNFNVSFEAPVGVDVVVTPSSMMLAEGESADYTVSLTANGGIASGEWSFGSLTWSNDAGASDARSPIAVRTVQLDAPTNVDGHGTDGATSFDIGFGYGGVYNAGTHGMVAATRTVGNVIDDPANDINTALDEGYFTLHVISADPSAPLARFALFNDETDGAADDLDLYVFDGNTFAFLGQSGNAASDEQVDIVGAGTDVYIVIVHGWETDGPDANYTLFSWVPGADAGNMTVTAPAAATLGATETVVVDWTGLGADKYMGTVSHSDGSGPLGATAITVDTE